MKLQVVDSCSPSWVMWAGERSIAMRSGSRRKGFTLVELLVVIGIIALLISILLPALQAAKKQAQMVQCSSNLHQFFMAFNAYASDNSGWIPPSTYGVAQSPYPYWINWLTTVNPPANYWPDYYKNYLGTGQIAYCPSAVPVKEGVMRGTYGINRQMYNGPSGGNWFKIVIFDTTTNNWEIFYNLFRTKRPSETYLLGDSTLAGATSYNPIFITPQMDFRHGSKANRLNILFHDGHVDNFVPANIPSSSVAITAGPPWGNN